MKVNKTDMWRRIGSALCLFLMVGFVACDDDDDDVQPYGGERFYSDVSSANVFQSWDLNNTNSLEENEFLASFYETWDLDIDGVLEASEWNTAVVDHNIVGEEFAVWDADNDGMLERTEFDTGFTALDYYDLWDLDDDGLIMEREYTDGVYGLWDPDGDGIMEEAEYNTLYGRYYGV